MSVQPSIRLPATATADGAAVVPGDAAGLADLFNQLVAGLKDGDAEPKDGEAKAAPTTEQPGEATPARILAASVEQLIALATGHHAAGSHPAKAKTDEKGDQGGDGTGAAPPTPTLSVAPAPTGTLAAAVAPSAPAVLIADTAPIQAAALSLIAGATTPAMASGAKAPAAAQPQDASGPAEQDQPASPDPAQAGTKPPVPIQVQPTNLAGLTPVAANDPIQALARSLLADISSQITGRPTSSERTHAAEAPLPAIGGDQAASIQPSIQAAAPFQAPAAQPTDAAVPQPLQGLVIERQLDLAHQQDWIDQLARDIAGAAGGEGKALRFRLNPETLGSLHVEIAQSHHGAAVRISADTESARTIIADAQQRLVAEARAQGVRISETHVDLGSGGNSGDPRRQATLRPDEVPVRTARSLQEDEGGDGKPTPNGNELYA